jgi:ElaB/YqjD/DUF883 family membrane-anchored ribosome-binding protein
MKKVNIKEAGGHKMALGVGIAAAVAAAAGAYFLYGSAKGPARRKAIKTWSIKMKAEVMEEVEKMQDISEEVYHSAIDKVSKKYADMKGIDVKELETTVKQLKGHWKDIKKEAEKAIKKGAKLV